MNYTNTSMRLVTIVALLLYSSSFAFAEDAYEQDNTSSQAAIITIDNNMFQHHTIHTASDVDWVKFYALAGEGYTIEAYNFTSDFDAYIGLYGTDGESLIIEGYDPITGGNKTEQTLSWICQVDGVYFAKIGHRYPQTYQDGASYDLKIYDSSLLTLPVYLTGTITGSLNKPIANALIKLVGTEDKGSGLSGANGAFIASATSGNYTVTLSASGYQTLIRTGVAVPGSLNVSLVRLNTQPVAVADMIECDIGGTVTGNVLTNDRDQDGDALTALLDTGVGHGVLVFQETGQITYTHDGSETDGDSFTYHVTDGIASSASVKVSITIQHPSHPGHLPFLMLLLE